MKNMIYKFINRYGPFAFFRLFFSPITVILTTPFRLFQLLWDSRILADGKWSQYSGFSAQFGILQLFYWTQALNLDRYGFSGISPTIGIGKYQLSRWFYLCLPSIYLNWKASNVTILTSLFCFALFYFLWIDNISFWIVFIVLITLIGSSSFYRLIGTQNYNSVGWMFFPIALYGLYIEKWWIVALGWLLVSFGSTTALFFAGIFSVASCIYFMSLWPLISIIPALIKILFHFIGALKLENLKISILSVMRGIGASKSKAKYVRYTNKERIFHPKIIYFILLYLIFLMFAFCQAVSIFTVLFLISIFLFILNEWFIFRFADTWSFWILLLSLSTAIILGDFSWKLFAVYVLFCNPIPLFLQDWYSTKHIDIVHRLKPFNIDPIIEEIGIFLRKVPENRKILICYEDPKGNYLDIFDGYKIINEALFYAASKKGIHVFPDEYAVFEDNIHKNIFLWGRDDDSIKRNIKFWKADYVIIYDTEKNPINIDKFGYEIISKFNWNKFAENFKDTSPYGFLDHPRWYLCKVSSPPCQDSCHMI